MIERNVPRVDNFDWGRIRLPLIPDVARSCAEYLFSLPMTQMTDQLKNLSDSRPELLEALMDSPTFITEYSDTVLTLLRSAPKEYRDLLINQV